MKWCMCYGRPVGLSGLFPSDSGKTVVHAYCVCHVFCMSSESQGTAARSSHVQGNVCLGNTVHDSAIQERTSSEGLCAVSFLDLFYKSRSEEKRSLVK